MIKGNTPLNKDLVALLDDPQGEASVPESSQSDTKPSKRELWEEKNRAKSAVDGRSGLEHAPQETQELIAYLLVNGMSMEEVCERTQLSPNTISGLRQCEDFQQLMIQEARKIGQRAIQKMITSALPEVIIAVINIATSGSTPIKEKLQAATCLLDRGIGRPIPGKPLDTGVGDETPETDPLEESRRLDDKIDSLQQKLYPTSGASSDKTGT